MGNKTKLGNLDTSKFCLGNTQADRLYLGTNRVYGLPKEYQEVEYIESESGYQKINTGYAFTSDNVKLEFSLMPTGSLEGASFGSCTTANKNWLVLYRNTLYGGSTSNVYTETQLQQNVKYNGTYIFNNGVANLNGNLRTYNGTIVSGSPFIIFNYTLSNGIKERVYYFNIYENDVLVRKLIPCYRKSDQVIGLYDLVNDAFYTNSGSGTFIAGPEIHHLPNTYQQVEYIESNGVQYIDTNLTPNNSKTYKIDIDFTYSDINLAGMVIGTRDNSGNRLSLLWSYYNTKAGVYIGTNLDFYNIWTINTRYQCSLTMGGGKYNFVRNGTTEANQVSYGGSLPQSHIGLFAQLVSSSTRDTSTSSKMYGCKIYENNVLIRNLVPCYRKSDNEIGLYDKANNVFYTNLGSGAFTKGENV